MAIHDDESGYRITEQCPSELTFPSDSKGFEGATGVRGADGVLYMLGLCEVGDWDRDDDDDSWHLRMRFMRYLISPLSSHQVSSISAC